MPAPILGQPPPPATLLATDPRQLQTLERLVAFALAALSFVFAAQSLVLLLALPLFEEMLTGFSVKLPLLTELAFAYRPAWAGLAICGLGAVFAIARKPPLTRARVTLLCLLALLQFVLAQLVTLAPHLPVFALSAAAGS